MDDSETLRQLSDEAEKEMRLKAEQPKYMIDKRYCDWLMQMQKAERDSGLYGKSE